MCVACVGALNRGDLSKSSLRFGRLLFGDVGEGQGS